MQSCDGLLQGEGGCFLKCIKLRDILQKQYFNLQFLTDAKDFN